MKNLAPKIYRQRILIEGFYTIEVNKEVIDRYLRECAAHLDLRIYSDPIIFSPSTGMGKGDNQGFDAFVPLIDSGISAYFWSESKFLSIIIYTCKEFNEEKSINYTQTFFSMGTNIEFISF